MCFIPLLWCTFLFFCFWHSQHLNPSFSGSLLYWFCGWPRAEVSAQDFEFEAWPSEVGMVEVSFWPWWGLCPSPGQQGPPTSDVVWGCHPAWFMVTLGSCLFFEHSSSVLNKNFYDWKLFWKKGFIGPYVSQKKDQVLGHAVWIPSSRVDGKDKYANTSSLLGLMGLF